MAAFWGIDGCRAGWLAICLHSPDFRVITSRQGLADLFDLAAGIWIDIPVGLADNGPRTCDQLLRCALGKTGASVFTPPVRAAIDAPDYKQACDINERATGKRITRQVWNITGKIRQVDELLIKQKVRASRVFESHPEYLFLLLNNGVALPRKKSQEGQRQRVELLREHFPKSEEFINEIRNRFTKTELANDDITDAMVLALAATQSAANSESIGSLPGQPQIDSKGVPMAVYYVNKIER